jgi:hypothetical protein
MWAFPGRGLARAREQLRWANFQKFVFPSCLAVPICVRSLLDLIQMCCICRADPSQKEISLHTGVLMYIMMERSRSPQNILWTLRTNRARLREAA